MIEISEVKESARPAQPNASKDISEPTTQRKSTTIIARKQSRRKAIIRRRKLMAAGASVLLVIIAVTVVVARQRPKEVQDEQHPVVITSDAAPFSSSPEPEEEAEPIQPEVIMVYFQAAGAEETTAVDLQELASSWAAEYGTTLRYELTDAERWEIASVVEAEAGAECFAGKEAVAQCILQACEDDGIRPTEAVQKYRYTKRRPEPSKESLLAVSAIFDFGWAVTSEPIKYFYAPDRTTSNWHESQIYVVTIGGHRFFREEGSADGNTIHGQDVSD